MIMFLFGKKSQGSQQGGAQAQTEGLQGEALQNAARQKEAQENRDGLKKKEESIKSFIDILKKQHAEGMVSDKTFGETLARNEEELKRIRSGSAPPQNEAASADSGNAAAEKAKIEGGGVPAENIEESGREKTGKGQIGDNAASRKKEKKKKPDSAKNISEENEPQDSASGGEAEGKPIAAQESAEKTVGDILKEEGVIHDEEKTGKVKIEQEVDMSKMLMDIEKLTAEVEALRDIKFQSDERIKEIAESIGEMRSLIFQRDGSIKEAQMKIEKMEDAIYDIKPEKLAKEMRKREEEIMESGAKIEKLERMTGDMSQQIKGVQKLLESIGSVKNLAGISRDIEERLSKMEGLKRGVERDAEKSEKMYLELEKRMQEFAQVRESVKNLDGLTKELMKSMDEEKIKIGSLASREDLQKAVEAATSLPSAGKAREDKAREKGEIEAFLGGLEAQYRKGIISKRSFDEVREKNNSAIEILGREIKEAEEGKTPKTVFEWMENMEKEMKGIKMKMSEYGGYVPDEDISADAMPPGNNFPTPSEPKKIPAAQRSPREEEIQGIRNFLSGLEDQYREGLISDDAFDEAKAKNMKRLAELENPESAIPDRKIMRAEPAQKKVFKPEGGKKNNESGKINALLAELEK